ncbi:MAG: protein kinase [Polyangiaceae bacterium]
MRAIARGGMGAVYEVLHVETERRSALKVMLPSVLGSEDLRNRFRAEARVASSIESEHIVEIFDAGVDKATGHPFLVMELLRGQELSAAIEAQGAIPAERALTILDQLSRTLDKTHAAKVVHRDLKPDNVFLTTREDGTMRVKILDFGIAKIIAEGNQQTRKLGTPLYAAPEQFSGAAPISPQTDLYALAHIAFTMLVGTPYWMEEMNSSDSVQAFLTSLQLDRTEAASSRAKAYGSVLPAGFDPWFKRATALDASARFGSAGEQHAALVSVLRAPRASAPASAKADLGTMDFLANQGGDAPSSRARAPAESTPEPSSAVPAASTPMPSAAAPTPSTLASPKGVAGVSGASDAPRVPVERTEKERAIAGQSTLSSAREGEASKPVHPSEAGDAHARETLAKQTLANELAANELATKERASREAPGAAEPARAEPVRRGAPIGLIALGGAALVGLVVGGVVLLGGKSAPAGASADASSSAPAATSAMVASKPSAPTPRPRASASAAAAPSAQAALDEITFSKPNPRVGERTVTTKTRVTSVNVTRPPKGDVKTTESSATTETILAADGKTILKMKVAYGDVTSETVEGGKSTTTKTPVSNKTYVVEFKGGALVVTDENYKPVPAAEADIVKKDEAESVGKPTPTLTSLPDGPVKRGAAVDTIAEILRTEAADAKTDVSDVVVKLERVETDRGGHRVGVFAVSLKVVNHEAEFATAMTLKGSLSIREDARPIAYALEGPVTLKGAQIDVAGTWSLRIEAE